MKTTAKRMEGKATIWVAVSEKLPKDVTPVLVYGECCDICQYIKIAELEQGEWWESGTGEDLGFKPTYWAELPKLPCKC